MINPSGHSLSKIDNPNIHDIENELERALKDHFSETEFECVIKRIDPSPKSAQLVAMRNFYYHDKVKIINFLNATYNFCSSRFINHDFGLESLALIGCSLPHDKLLYISCPTSYHTGWRAEGIVVSNAPLTNHACHMNHSGIFVQCAPAQELMGLSTQGLTISLEGPKNYGKKDLNGNIVRHDEVNHDLRDYCRHLVDVCGQGKEAIHETFGDVPTDSIRRSIYSLLDRRPRGWPR